MLPTASGAKKRNMQCKNADIIPATCEKVAGMTRYTMGNKDDVIWQGQTDLWR
jgi:hypothetical protein